MKFYKERVLLEGTRVYVYFNLHKKCFSLRALEGPYKGKVCAHSDAVSLSSCIFTVSQSGRERVLRERQKNIHAGVIGDLCFNTNVQPPSVEVTYNPYVYDSFVQKVTKQPIIRAAVAYLDNKRVFIEGGAFNAM